MSLPSPPSAFASLGLSPPALEALARLGFESPTPIQAQAIPPALAGHDVIGGAATGTGKTAAFLLPLIDRLAGKRGTRALVLAPTRELVMQILEQVKALGGQRHFRGACIIGGEAMGPQVRALKEQSEIIVATPGRLCDHLNRGTVRLDQIEVLVLDEADRMLDMGFRAQLDAILSRVPRNRQTLLFSATIGGEVGGFAKRHLKDPVRVEVAKSGTMARKATQAVYHVHEADKPALLLSLLAKDQDSTLVFTRTQHRADKLAKTLARAGVNVARIHGGRSQSQRKHALEGFRAGAYRVLVATDIAARGIDVVGIGHVVNFDLSHSPEDHVHRVGRTARAEASGHASTLASPPEGKLLRDIERFTRTQLPRCELPADLAHWRAEIERTLVAARTNASSRPSTRAHGGGSRGGHGKGRGPDRFGGRGHGGGFAPRGDRGEHRGEPRGEHRGEHRGRFHAGEARDTHRDDVAPRSTPHSPSSGSRRPYRAEPTPRGEGGGHSERSDQRPHAPRPAREFDARPSRSKWAPRKPRGDFAPRPPRGDASHPHSGHAAPRHPDSGSESRPHHGGPRNGPRKPSSSPGSRGFSPARDRNAHRKRGHA
ncbi:MAG: DEAD/DEAH box helicase [Planctomycetes bacterium]|nr:DEAD/DEAH box helicase [Planctomycetota bacterium]